MKMVSCSIIIDLRRRTNNSNNNNLLEKKYSILKQSIDSIYQIIAINYSSD